MTDKWKLNLFPIKMKKENTVMTVHDGQTFVMKIFHEQTTVYFNFFGICQKEIVSWFWRRAVLNEKYWMSYYDHKILLK